MTIKEMINGLSAEKDSLRKENVNLKNKVADLTDKNLEQELKIKALTELVEEMQRRIDNLVVVETPVETTENVENTETGETTEQVKKKRTRKKKTEE